MLTTRVDVTNLNRDLAILKKISPTLMKEFRKELRGRLQPYASAIANSIPGNPPISGMNHNGVTRWEGKPKGRVNFSPRGRRNALIGLIFTGGTRQNGPLGFDYAEVAGIRRRPPRAVSRIYEDQFGTLKTHRVNGQGDAMIRAIRRRKPIPGKAGYFAFDQALQKFPLLKKIAELSLARFTSDVNNELSGVRFLNSGRRV